MVGDDLSDQMIEAGYRVMWTTDVLRMQAQGAMWIRRHELQDWRYYLVTSLVDTIGRRETYKLLLRIFNAPGADEFFPKEMTVEDIHLGSPLDEYFQSLSQGLGAIIFPTGKNRVRFTDCVVNGLKFDAVVYRIVQSPTRQEAKLIEKQFSARVKALEAGGLTT